MSNVKKSIKTTIFLLLALVCVIGAQAQGRKVIYSQNYDKAPYHIGFLLGINYMTYNVTLQDNYQGIDRPSEELPSNPQGHTYRITGIDPLSDLNNVGISIGVIGDKRIGNYFNLRFIPTVSFGPNRNIVYSYYKDGNIDNIETITSNDINSNFFEFPIHIKYRSKRYNNVGAYLISGLNPSLYLIRSKNQLNNDVPALLQTKMADMAFDIGSGFDIYNQWFKMSLEIKMSFGLFNVLKTDETSMGCIYNVPFKEVKNKHLQISLTIE